MPENQVITPDDLPEDFEGVTSTSGIQAGPMPRRHGSANASFRLWTSGMDVGVYDGATAAEAVDNYVRSAGYGSVDEAASVLGMTVERFWDELQWEEVVGQNARRRNPRSAADVISGAQAAIARSRQLRADIAARRGGRQGGSAPRRAVGSEVQNALAEVHRAVADMRAEHRLDERDRRRGRSDVIRRETVARLDRRIDAAERHEASLIRRDRTRDAIDAMARTMDAQARQISALRRGRFDHPVQDARGRTLSAASQRHIRAFGDYMRRGEDAGMRQVMAALTTREDTGGGYFMPEEWDRTMSRLLLDTSVMRQISTVREISGPLLKMPKNLGGTDAGWIGETTAPSETNTSTLAELQFTVMEMYAQPKASQQLLEDASIDIEAWIAEEVQEAFTILENPAFMTGTGANQPRGLHSYGWVANATYEAAPATYWGKFGYVATGAAGNWATSNPGDALFDVENALRPAARTNAAWLINRPLIAEIRKFKDSTGNYLWERSLTAGKPATLLTYPVYADDYMPAKAANSYSLALGDWAKTYLILDRLGSTVLRDPFTAKPYVLFYTRKRVGGGVKEFQYAKFLKFAAS